MPRLDKFSKFVQSFIPTVRSRKQIGSYAPLVGKGVLLGMTDK